MALQTALSDRDRTALNLVGSFVEIYWDATSRMAKRQCEKCVYVVRGVDSGLVCVELIYDAIEGEHRHDRIFWVPTQAVQYMRVLSEPAARFRIESLEREATPEGPLD